MTRTSVFKVSHTTSRRAIRFSRRLLLAVYGWLRMIMGSTLWTLRVWLLVLQDQ
jgi:hypothetical protein